MPLNNKFSTVIVIALAIPAVVVLLLSFNRMRQDEKDNISAVALRDLDKIDIFAQNNSNMASTIVQVVNTNPELTNMLYKKLTTAQLIEFNTNVLPYFENIVTTNPYIKNLRIYTDSDMIAERYPIIVDKTRIENEQWYIDASISVLQKRVGYSENLSEHIAQFSGDSLIAYYQALEIHQGEKTVVEVSFSMENFFGEVYSAAENGLCLIKVNDEFFMHDFGNNGNTDLLIETLSKIEDDD